MNKQLTNQQLDALIENISSNLELQEKRYVEDYYQESVKRFPESVPFSNNEREYNSMAQSLWLAFGRATVASGDNKLQNKFIKAMEKMDLLEKSS